jgi:tetratricopeptide (TPR) repeat protein
MSVETNPTLQDHEMITIEEWMGDLRRHGNDCNWVNRNFDLLYEAVMHGLGYERRAHLAIEAINILFPCVIHRDDYRRWEVALYDALGHAQNMHNSEIKALVWEKLGENFLKYGARKAADNAFENANAYAEDAGSPEMLLLARIGSIRNEGIYKRRDFHELVAEILQLCRQVTHPELIAGAHSALTLAYMFRFETPQALGHGQMAYALWHQLKNAAQKAEMAFTMAEACRVAKRFEQAERFSNLGKTNLSGTDYAHKSAVFAYQTGVLYLTQKKDYETAEEWFGLALEKFSHLDFPYLTGAAHHALGIAQTELGKFGEASSNLKTALIQWRQLQNWHEQASVNHAIGYLEHKQQKFDQARRHYEWANALAQYLPDSPARQSLIDEINDDLNKLDNDSQG